MSSEPKSKADAGEAPRISDAEWTVLKAVWQLKTPTAREVVEKLKDEMRWKPKTIHTLLGRLVQKKAVARENPAREYTYRPLVTERECRLSASRSFLEKVFDGEIAPFLATFLQTRKLSRKEINELRSILEEESE